MRRSGRARSVAVVLGLGVVVMVAGTFAPWLRSGQVTRNSYRTAGLLRRLLDLHGAAGLALDAIPLVAVLSATGAALVILGYRRSALALVAVLAGLLATLSAAVLLAPGSAEITVTDWGPVITLAGAAITLTAVIASVVVHSADRSRGQDAANRVE